MVIDVAERLLREIMGGLRFSSAYSPYLIDASGVLLYELSRAGSAQGVDIAEAAVSGEGNVPAAWAEETLRTTVNRSRGL